MWAFVGVRKPEVGFIEENKGKQEINKKGKILEMERIFMTDGDIEISCPGVL